VKPLNQIKNSGFKTPKNYFNDLENHLINDLKLREKIKNSGFIMPDQYIEHVDHSIIKQIKNSSSKVILFKRNYTIIVSSIAATIFLIITLTLIKTSPGLELLENETIENYVLEEFESHDLLSLISETEVSESDFINYELSISNLENIIENDEDLEFYMN